MTMRRVLTLLALALGVLAASACSTTPDHDDADVAFVQQMIPHHRSALEMADLAPERASSPEVRSLATAIRDGQGPEIEQMTGYLADWDVPADTATSSGMAMDTTALRTLSGPAFDRRWVEEMTVHHQGAVQMADQVLGTGTSGDVHALALRIRDAQTREIAEMSSLRARLG